MPDQGTFAQRWQEYRASKATLFWACLGAVVLTMIVGFTWGGWVTGGTAAQTAEKAAQQARAELAATICVERFMGAEDAQVQLASLQETGSWQRDDFVEKGGWAALPGLDEPVPGAADLCADRLAEMELTTSEQDTQQSEAATSTE